MATATAVIKRAARLAKVLDREESLSTQEETDAILMLNEMLYEWEGQGMSLGFVTIAAGSDTVAVPDEMLNAVANNLALKLCAEYGKQPSLVVVKDAEDGFRFVEAYSHRRVSLSTAHLPGGTEGFDINSG